MYNPCQPVITQRGDFCSDQYMETARKTLQDLVTQMQNCTNRQLQSPAGRVDYLLAELGAWQQSGHTLNAAMGVRQEDAFSTVFRFERDCLKMLVDVHGFQPFNLKLHVESGEVELTASREEVSTVTAPPGKDQNCVGYAVRSVTRRYELPQRIRKECVQCSLSADGILFISMPWLGS